MKLLFLILGLTLFNFGYCQNQQIAKITKTIEDSEVIYSFKPIMKFLNGRLYNYLKG